MFSISSDKGLKMKYYELCLQIIFEVGDPLDCFPKAKDTECVCVLVYQTMSCFGTE